jgi:hypothetical protein
MSKITSVLSASGQAISAGVGIIDKIVVSTHSSGVIKLVDSPNSSAGRVILSDYTLNAGADVIELGVEYYEGVYFVLVSGTATLQLTYSLGK